MKESVRPASSTYRIISETYTLKKQILNRPLKKLLFRTIERVALGAALYLVAAGIIVHSAIAQELSPPATTGIANNRVALANSTHPGARTAADLGRVAPDL